MRRYRPVLFWGITVVIVLASFLGYLLSPPEFWKDYLPVPLSILALALSVAAKLEPWLTPFRPEVVLESAMLVRSAIHPGAEHSDLTLSMVVANSGSVHGTIESLYAKVTDSEGSETYWVSIYEVDPQSLLQLPTKEHTVARSVTGLTTRFALGKGERVHRTGYFVRAGQVAHAVGHWKAGDYRLVLYVRTHQDKKGKEIAQASFRVPPSVLEQYSSEQWLAMPIPL